ncbi:uncharacterized protein [Littorina saxatilis]|uniref:uncharacterized protein n=1 Tax=Littorina saxatilis TaxID=31220 RepID=UPI0038B42CA3
MASKPNFLSFKLACLVCFIISVYVHRVVSPSCSPEREKRTRLRRRLKSCEIEPESALPNEIPKTQLQCRYRCKYRGMSRPRGITRFGEEVTPSFQFYPRNSDPPDYVQDVRFCLVLVGFYWDQPEDVVYDVGLGTFSCRLKVWENGRPGRDVEVVEVSNPRRQEFFVRFSHQFYNENNGMGMSTTAQRLSATPDFTYTMSPKNQRNKFPGEIRDEMVNCINVLAIEGTSELPQRIFDPTDRCKTQQFRLSYPPDCTSLPFEGGWKRGQTVTSASWTFALVDHPDDSACVDVFHAEVYSVINEFNDRYIDVEARNLKAGLNRICNTFQFTGTFGPKGKRKDYGPYDIKKCGFIRVEQTPCLIVKPKSTGQDVRLPVGDTYTLDASQTIEVGQTASDYSFEWTCTEIKPAANTSCTINAADDPVFVFIASRTFEDKEVELKVTVTYKRGTYQAASASEARRVLTVDVNALRITVTCVSNCNERTISVSEAVLRVDCANCPDVLDLEYTWTVTEVTNNVSKEVTGTELQRLVENGDVGGQIFSTNAAANYLLDRVFDVCVLVKKKSSGHNGEACKQLDFRGAPVPFKGDSCIISPYSGLPGFLEWTYSGLCIWRGNRESLLYKVFTYDVGVPENERTYDLVAFSDISRMPSLELPFGNPKHDFELGVSFEISNDEGLTYVFNLNEAFKQKNIVFKVRQPVDFDYLDKVSTITDNLLDRRKSGRFGSRQGIMNVAGLVAKVVENDAGTRGSGFEKDKRVKIRENLLSSLLTLADSDVNTVKQLTPIIDTLTRSEEEVSDVVEERGAEILFSLTEGLKTIAATDSKTAARLTQTQHGILERFSSKSVERQATGQTLTTASDEDKKKFVERASNYSQMYLNIGAGLAASTLLPDTPKVVVKQSSAIAVTWVEMKADSVLGISKDRSDNSSFGSSVTLDAASLGVKEGTKVDVIMAVTDKNLYASGGGADNINMPMINMELQDRGNHQPIAAHSLAKPADIFVERTVNNETEGKWLWQRVNLTVPTDLTTVAPGQNPEPLSPEAGGSQVKVPANKLLHYLLQEEKNVTFDASDTHSILLRFTLSHDTFTVKLSATFIDGDGGRRPVFQDMDYPKKDGLREYKNVTQKPDVVFLSNTNETNGTYEILVKVTSKVSQTIYTEASAPHLMMLKALVSCQSWNANTSQWETSGCQITDMSNFEVLHCQCYHLSVFSGGVLVPPRPINVFDVALFREFFNNPAIVSIVVFIWLVYFIVVYWARDEDWLDTFRSRVAILEDNKITDKWAYLVCCVTGWWINSGTTAKVFIYIKGTRGMSRVHRLTDDEQELFVKGAENWFILTTPACLGKIKAVVVWHDSSGTSPAWFVKEVYVQDINKGDSWHCLYNDWISVEHGLGDLCVEIPAMDPEEIHKRKLYQMVLSTSLNLRNGHLWLSIALKPCYSPFTRVQRVTCAMTVLLTGMLANLMFFGIPSSDPEQQVTKGPLRLNLRSIAIGIESALVVMPINMLMGALFSQTSRRPSTRKYPVFDLDEECFHNAPEDTDSIGSFSLENDSEIEASSSVNDSSPEASSNTASPEDSGNTTSPEPSLNNTSPERSLNNTSPEPSLNNTSPERSVDTQSSVHSGSKPGGAVEVGVSSSDGLTTGSGETSQNIVQDISGGNELEKKSHSDVKVSSVSDKNENFSAADMELSESQRASAALVHNDVKHHDESGRMSTKQFGSREAFFGTDSSFTVAEASGGSDARDSLSNNICHLPTSKPFAAERGKKPASSVDNNLNSNNSAYMNNSKETQVKKPKRTDASKPESGRLSSDSQQRPYRTGHLSEQFSFITATPWFQNALTHLRHNVVRLVGESRKRDKRHSDKALPSSQTNSTYSCGAYFDKLKANKQEFLQPQGVKEPTTGSTDSANANTKVILEKTKSMQQTAMFEACASVEGKGNTEAKACTAIKTSMEAITSIEAKGKGITEAVLQSETSTNQLFEIKLSPGVPPCREKWEQTPLGEAREQRELPSETESYTTSYPQGVENERGDCSRKSYLDKLKEKTSRRKAKLHQPDTLTAVVPTHIGSGDQAPKQNEDGESEFYSSKELNSKQQMQTRPRKENSSPQQQRKAKLSEKVTKRSAGPRPQACWFCSQIPGQETTIRNHEAFTEKRVTPKRRESSKIKSDGNKKTFKAKLRKLGLRSCKQDPDPAPEARDPVEDIPFDTILQYHDYEYEQFQKKGPRALKSFRRRAAQCMAEDLLNSNVNAASATGLHTLNKNQNAAGERRKSGSKSKLSKSGSFDVEDDDNDDDDSEVIPPGRCTQCMTVTYNRVLTTVLCLFCCRCPAGTSLPWWSIYLTWTLAIVVNLSVSWVVMLYGLRLGYQGSVDWLTAFFTGFCNNVFLIQPVKVFIMSILYILILGQHVNVREVAGVTLYDENNQLLHVKMLKQYEARRKMLDGMWTSVDYEYPIPRSKAQDIKLRLEQDAKARMILRDTLIWCVFLVVVAIACQGHTIVEDASRTNDVARIMLEEGAYGDMSLEDIGKAEDVWDYLTDTLLPTLYAHPNRTTASGVSVVLGGIRLRQVRQKPGNDSCKSVIPREFSQYLGRAHCLPEFSFAVQDTRDFNHNWTTPITGQVAAMKDGLTKAWQYRSSTELQEPATWGERAVYPGGGYAIDLPGNDTEALETVERLKELEWLDLYTRGVLIDVNLYTPSKDLISSVTVLCEGEPEGPFSSKMFVHTVKLIFYQHERENIITMAEMGWLVMLSVSMYFEMEELIMLGAGDYMQSAWTYLELINFFLSLAAIGVHLARVIVVDYFLDRLFGLHFSCYVSFAMARVLDQTLDVLKSLVFVLVVLKVFRVLRFNRYFRVLLRSFVIARQSIINQTLIASITCMAFASICFLLYVSHLEDYRTFSATLGALLNFGLGEGDFYGWAYSQPILGPLLYFLFFFFFITMILSFFVTFIMESFNVARVFVQLNADEQHVKRYVVRICRLLIGATPRIKQVRRQRRTHPFKPASYNSNPVS